MKPSTLLWLVIILLSISCTDDFFEQHKEAFYKLYGNGTIQEAAAMHLEADGSVYITGTQYVRNQDSAAVILIKTNEAGNQLWSRKYYGKGHAMAQVILPMPTGELLILATNRPQDGTINTPLLLKINKAGELIKEYSIEPAAGAVPANNIAIDMVLGDNGSVYVLGNVYNGPTSDRSFIQKIDLATAMVVDQREFRNSEITEAKNIYRNGNQLFVLGNTWHELEGIRNQSIFLATYSLNLVEAGNTIVGTRNKDTFEKALLSSRSELIILSAEQETGSKVSRGTIWFTNPWTLAVHSKSYLDYSANDIPKAVQESETGELYIAVNAVGERGNTNILLNKTDKTAIPLWGSAKSIGGSGNDRIKEVKIAGEYVYLLSTLDMQNENTLISLSKIKF